MKKLVLLLALMGIGCGINGTQNFQITGTSYSYVIVRLEFIQEINALCKQSLLREDFASSELYEQAVSKCTLEKMSLFNINPTTVSSFQNTYCKEGADLSGFTLDEQADILAACGALNGK